jgi:hypothetical protein
VTKEHPKHTKTTKKKSQGLHEKKLSANNSFAANFSSFQQKKLRTFICCKFQIFKNISKIIQLTRKMDVSDNKSPNNYRNS